MDLKQSTVITISLGPFLDKDDGDTEKTGLTIEDTDVYLSKNGAAKAVPNDANDCTEDANGVYRKQINATDTNTLGILTVYVHFADCLYVRQDYNILRADVYDSKYGSDYQQVDVVQIGGVTQSQVDLKDLVDTGYDPATHKIQGVVLTDSNTDMVGTNNAALAATALSTAIWTAARAGYLDELAAANIPADVDTILTRLVGTILAGNHNAQTGDGYAIANHADYGNSKLVRSTIPANKLDVSATGEAGLDFDNIKDATAPKTLTNITIPVVTDVTNDVGIDAGSVDDIWDELLTGASHNIATSAGRRLRQASDAALILHEGTAQAGGNNTITLAAGASAVNETYHDGYVSLLGGTGAGQIRHIIAYDGGTKIATMSEDWATNPAADTEYAISGSASSDLHAINEDTQSCTDLKDLVDAGYNPATHKINGVVLTDSNTDMRGTNNAATEAKQDIIDTNVDSILVDTNEIQGKVPTNNIMGSSDVDNHDTDIDSILVDTGTTIPALIAALENISVADVETACDASLVSYDPPTKAEMDAVHATTDALIAALNDLSAAQVNAEVVDALATDTYGEPGQENPGATISLARKISYVYKFLRNLITNDGTTIRVYNDAGAIVDQKAGVSLAGGIVIREEFQTGP